MATQIALIPGEFNYEFTMSLLDIEYLFNIRWNARSSTWHMSLYDLDGNPLALGRRIVLGAAIGRTVASDDFPDGLFFATDLSGQDEEATFDDLGLRVVLHFVPRSELA